METKDVIKELRTRKGYSQDELAEKIHVTRQAVSRWETGETLPNTETLKLLSQLFDVSINTLLGSPRKLVCQCCGMPLEDSSISREIDGSFMAHEYGITQSGRTIVSIRKEWMTWGDSYELNITNPSDEIVALAVVLTIDCVMEAAATAASSS